MSELSTIANVLAMLLAGLEVLLFVFKETLSRAPQAHHIEKQIMEAKAETAKAKEITQRRETELAAAKTRSEASAAALRQANNDAADAPTAREIFVHEVGEPGILPIFRASLRRMLPDKPEPNQVLFWSYDNYVDVWATNPDAAEKVASRLFATQAGYQLGTFKAQETPAEKTPEKTSSTSQTVAA